MKSISTQTRLVRGDRLHHSPEIHEQFELVLNTVRIEEVVELANRKQKRTVRR